MKLETWRVGSGARTAALVHGASKAADVWRDFASILVADYGFTVILLDLRGHGRSPRADSYRVMDFAGDLIDSLPVGLDLLIGQSLGGVASAWACERLRPLRYIGLDPAYSLGMATSVATHLLSVLGPYRLRLADLLVRLAGRGAEQTADDVPERVRAMLKDWDASMMLQLVRSARRRPYPIGRPVVPSTLLLADNSTVVPATMAEALRTEGWDVRVKPGAVHDLHLQDPRGVIRMLDDVLRPRN